MLEEKKYPIYHFEARWNQDGYERNCSGSTNMFREKLTAIQEADALEKWWNNLLESPRMQEQEPIIKNLHPHILSLSIKYERDDTWCLRWFSHITFNQFTSEADIFMSFSRFVQEKLPLHHNLDLPQEEAKRLNLKTYCLMGAEQQWRWKLCGCDKCKEEGITAILH